MRRPPRTRTLEQVAGGDPAALRQLRADLASIGRQTDDRGTRDLVREVLAGRRGVDELTRSAEFERLGEEHVDNLLAGIETPEPEERERMLAISRPRSGEPLPEPTPDDALATLRDDATPTRGWRSEDAEPAGPGDAPDGRAGRDRHRP